MRRHHITHLRTSFVLAGAIRARAQGVSELVKDWPAAIPAERAFDTKTSARLDRRIAESSTSAALLICN